MAKERRETLRYKFRTFIQYEKLMDDGSFSVPVNVNARDIGPQSVSFYTEESMHLHSKVRVTFTVLEQEKISFIGQVVRMEIVEEPPYKFLVGLKMDDVDSENRKKIDRFLYKIDIENALKDLDLTDVVDIHFTAGYPPIAKKIGRLEISKCEPLGENTLRTLLLNILDEHRYKEFTREKEINFVYPYKDSVRFRVNLHVQQGKVEGVFRLIPDKISLPSELGLPPVAEQMIDNQRGLILVAGRTGSGKTTTLASMVEMLNEKRKGIIISVESPIEYIHTNRNCIIKQREVGRDTLSFFNAAKNALRQGPDVLLIGEILDKETIEVAVTAAETGMLVLTSIHAADSSQALDRVMSFFPAEMQKHILIRLSLVLKGVITQTLIPRSDGKGLVVGAEVVVVNDAIRRIVRDGDWRQIPTVIQTSRNIGMQSMKMSLERYYLQGIIDGEYLKEYM